MKQDLKKQKDRSDQQTPSSSKGLQKLKDWIWYMEEHPERFDLDFLKWVWNFNKNKREQYYRLLNEAEGVETIVLKNRRAVRKFLKQFQ